ncbi:MAG: ATP-binding protein [Actinomycetes bacterium]
MFLWIRDQKWLPALYLSLISFFVFGGIDVMLQGVLTLPAAILLTGSIAFARAKPWISIACFSVGLFVPIALGLEPQTAQLAATLSLLLLASFGSTLERRVGYGLNALLGTISYFWIVASLPVGSAVYGIELPTLNARIVIAVAGFIAMIAVNANAWFVGRLLITRITHVGTEFDRAILERKIAATQLALAEQEGRFEIARDVNDVLLEQVSATMTAAEAGIFAAKADVSVAPRILESVLDGVKKSYAEIRRLSDLLGLQKDKAIALPGLRDLNALIVSYREFGFGVNFRQTGVALELVDGAELVLYRIVFEALENMRKHTPNGTEVDIDFIWQLMAMQVVIKDNGEETARALEQGITGYSVDDDQKALVERPVGPGLVAMQERAFLYEGNVEFVRVPGVGFTVSAAFPNIAKYSKVK